MNEAKVWQATLGQLQLEMPKAAFDTWAKDAEYISHEDGLYIVGVKNAYARDWLDDRLSSTVNKIISGILRRTIEVRFIVWYGNPENHDREAIKPCSKDTPRKSENSSISRRYGFDNFIVGSSNRLAHAASLAVSEKPAKAYNPLYLYGGVGLGKTHLLHAIGNECTENNLSVLYVSSEEFTNDLINAIRTHTTQAFREKYRRTDVLLIDDIQFIAGKESTQEEFFHTFNTLHGQDKQIVMTSDRTPKAMVTLEDRLRSRFGWGLTADVQAPDFETRVAILRSKAERGNYNVGDDVIDIIARRFQSNIRELEGALTRIVAYANLRGVGLTPDLVDIALADLLPRQRDIQPDQIIRIVAELFDLKEEQLLSRDRSRKIAHPRQVAMYLLREEAKLSFPQIGSALGGRDHTTILYGYEKICDLIESDHILRRKVIEIREKLYGKPIYA